MRTSSPVRDNHDMANTTLSAFSDELAALVASTAPSVLQVQGRRRAASGIAIGDDAVITMIRALGREEGLQVRRDDGQSFSAELAGWDPATGIAVLRAKGLGAPAVQIAKDTPRTGHIAVAVARSWSNVVTASAGIVAIIGGPLQTGRRRSIEQVFRTTAPMHDGFAGGAFVGASGEVIGITTASSIRGLGVVIPAPIAWRAASDVLKHGSPRRAYLGVSGQPVQLGGRQKEVIGRDRALLVVGLTSGGPAETAGLLVGDVLAEFDGQPVSSPEDLLDLLVAERIGKSAQVKLLRGGAVQDVTVTASERTA